ncbi:hypothetical protein DID88_003526 [Monilinia fructigena]|uniref:Uncharacterized protein n=1 Tax=Monilinia fructigena TaxID=38457 RepID=A0A395IWT7_9HELO|nr:hypothetical protein DID88_003526 [Monilinia fructigena]
MDQTPPESSPGTQATLPSEPDLIPGTEHQWQSASISPKIPKSRSCGEDAAQSLIKAEDATLEEIDVIQMIAPPKPKSADKEAIQIRIKAEDNDLEEIDAAA